MNAQDRENIQDFGDEVEGSFTPETRNISPKDKLQFAKWVLKGIFIFFLISIGVWMYQQSCGETLLDICRTGLLPIGTFVIGDYFGSRNP